jgi:esterase/lipase
VSAGASYRAALGALAAIAAADAGDPAIDPRCVPLVLAHASPAPRAIVLFHGFTNCPRQFSEFAQLLFGAGYNVYVPRLPRHGLRDKLGTSLAGLTAEELCTFAQTSVRLATGLGTTLSVLGLSVGATLTAWLAQTQPLDRAVAVAPFFSVNRVGTLLQPVLAGALELAPNAELWWDPRVKARAKPDHAYPRFATHGLAHCLDLGRRIYDCARDAPARAASSILVLNAKDPAIDAGAARDVWAAWRAGGSSTAEFTFANLAARHDIIEPVTYPAASTLVYPVLLRLLDR